MPFLSDEWIDDNFIYGPLMSTPEEAWEKGTRKVRDIYESARQSDLAKIEAPTKLAQELVAALVTVETKTSPSGVGFTRTWNDTLLRAALNNATLLSITPTPEPK